MTLAAQRPVHPDVAEILISEDELAAKVAELAAAIDRDYAGRDVILVGVLKGAIMVMADLARVIARTASGTVSVNETVLHAAVEALPFGGIGASGLGAYHGRAGFETFTHRRPVFVQSRFSPTRLLRPPYGPRADRLLRVLLR